MPLFPTSVAAQPPDETIYYNVYCVYFIEPDDGRSHQGVALVPAEREYQKAGRFYHVIGSPATGMMYECRPAYNFGADPAFVNKIFQFRMPKNYLPDLEYIARSRPRPFEPRLLTEPNLYGVRNGGHWVGDVIVCLERYLRSRGLAV
jgi:hypothetical protein